MGGRELSAKSTRCRFAGWGVTHILSQGGLVDYRVVFIFDAGFRARALACLVLAALLARPALAADITSTWDGTTNNWSSAHWSNVPSTSFFPNNGNGGFTYDAVINSGTVTLDQEIAIQKLTFGGGAINGNNDLKISGDFNWFGGSLGGAGVTTVGGGLWGGIDKYLESRTLEIQGDVNWSSGEIYRPSTSANHGTMVIKNGATFTASGAQASNRNIDVNLHVEAGGKFIGTGLRGTFIAHQFFAGPGGHVINDGIIEAAANTHVSLPGGYGDGAFIVRENASMIVMLLDANEFQYTGDVILDNGYFDVYLFDNTGTTLEVEFLLPAALRGTGQFKVDKLINSRLIAPGQGIGSLEVHGDYEQATTGKLEMELYGTSAGQFDTLSVTGHAALGGTLVVDATNLASVPVGTLFPIMTAASASGAFENIELLGDSNIYFAVRQVNLGAGSGQNDGTTIYVERLDRGDMNGDGIITQADYDLFVFGLMNNSTSKFFNKCNCDILPQQGGDFSGNGRLDFDDIVGFRAQVSGMGMSSAGLNAALDRYMGVVPEPGSVTLALIFGMFAAVGAGRQRFDKRNWFLQATQRKFGDKGPVL